MRRYAPVAMFVTVAALSVASPAAEACSWVFPDGFQSIEWSHDSVLLTNVGYEVGRLHRSNATFGVLADGFPGLRYAASADGRWLVNASGHTDPGRGPSTDSCAIGFGQTRAADTVGGLTFELAPAAAQDIAGSGEGVLLSLADSEDLVYCQWGSWDRVVFVPPPTGDEANDLDLHGLPPSRFFLVAPSDGPALILDPDDGSYVALDPVVSRAGGIHVYPPEADPDGRHVAVLWREDGARYDEPQTYQLGVFAVPEGKRVHRSFLVDEYMDNWAKSPLAWHPNGLAVALPTTLRILSRPLESDAAASYRPDAELTGGVAWSPRGDRIAAGVRTAEDPEASELWILDAGFRRIAHYSQPDLEPSWDAAWRAPVERHWDEASPVVVGQSPEAIPGAPMAVVLLALAWVAASRTRQRL